MWSKWPSVNVYPHAQMAPSKQVSEAIPEFGRFSSKLSVGIVGLPNVGKSSFFNILTNSAVSSENYPFCTIDPNESKVELPDERLEHLTQLYKPKKKIPAFLHVTDIAGLIQGASEGKGLGNAFLSHIMACDAIFQMIRVFADEEVVHVETTIDPVRDVEIIMNELRLKDVELLQGIMYKVDKDLRHCKSQETVLEKKCLEKVQKVLEEDKKWIRHDTTWTAGEVEIINKHVFLTTKPVIYLVNLSKEELIKKKSRGLKDILEWVKTHDSNAKIHPLSIPLELELLEEKKAGAPKEKMDEQSVMPKIIRTGFTKLGLINYFTCGPEEVRAWTIKAGTKAPQAAGKIHTDMEKGFIMAEVMSFDDLKQHGCEQSVKNAGRYRHEGKNYVVQDGDILHFKFNVTTVAKKK